MLKFVASLLALIAGLLPEAALAEPAVGPVRLLLPPAIPAVVGIECRVSFDNVVLAPNPVNYVFDAVCSRGRQQVER